MIGLEPGLPDWTTEEMTVSYQGFPLTLRPETEDRLATIAIPFVRPQTRADAIRAGRRFLSAFSWLQDGRGRVREAHSGGGGFPIWLGKSPWHPPHLPGFHGRLDLDHLQEPSEPKTWLALSIYREAGYLNSDAYRLLGYFRVINILADKGPDQKAWIQAALPLIKSRGGLARVRELSNAEKDIPKYLYEFGRCAVAHAYGDPVVDPDDPDDQGRVQSDLPLVRALAAHAIEHAFEVKSTRTIFGEHLYQLAGFRNMLGVDLVQRIKAEEAVPLDVLPGFRPISVRFREKPPLESFEQMLVLPLRVERGTVLLQLTSQDQLAVAIFGLDFRSEHLLFNFKDGLLTRDDGSPAAVQKTIDYLRVLESCIRNGRVELWDSEAGSLLGQSDPIILTNIDGGRSLDAIRERTLKLREELERRRTAIKAQGV